MFYYKNLKYQINGNKALPLAYIFEKEFDKCFSQDRLRNGLTAEEVSIRKELYGLN